MPFPKQDLRYDQTQPNFTFDDFPVGTEVRVNTQIQDLMAFRGDELGIVIENKGAYLGLIVRFTYPDLRRWDGTPIRRFNFEPCDLIPLKKPGQTLIHQLLNEYMAEG